MKLVTFSRSAWLTLKGLAFALVVAVATALPAHATMWTDAETEIETNITALSALLVTIFGVTLAFIVFKLVKRGTSKV
jgi:hypothetical protein